jgi:methionine-rich copper-binding protein CopC
LLVLIGTGAVLAHAKMTTSVPADGATVPAGLSEIEMSFSHPMRLTLVRVHGAVDDKDVELRGALPKGFAESAKVPIDILAAGAYDVSWTAVSEDGHVMKGHFSFKVTGPAAPAQ